MPAASGEDHAARDLALVRMNRHAGRSARRRCRARAWPAASRLRPRDRARRGSRPPRHRTARYEPASRVAAALKCGTCASTQAMKPFMSVAPRPTMRSAALRRGEGRAGPVLAFDRHHVGMRGQHDAGAIRRPDGREDRRLLAGRDRECGARRCRAASDSSRSRPRYRDWIRCETDGNPISASRIRQRGLRLGHRVVFTKSVYIRSSPRKRGPRAKNAGFPLSRE